MLAEQLKPLIAEKAKERQGARTDIRQNSDECSGRTDEDLAKIAGVSRDTIRKVEKIESQGVPELRAAASKGEVSIDADKGSFVVEIAPRAYAVLTREKLASILNGALAR